MPIMRTRKEKNAENGRKRFPNSDCRNFRPLNEIGVAESNSVVKIAAASSEMAVFAYAQ